MFLSVDANFGLCRKKAAGRSVREPLHKGTYFLPQSVIDDYVKSYGSTGAITQKVSKESHMSTQG